MPQLLQTLKTPVVKYSILGVLSFILLIILSTSFFTIKEGHRGIVTLNHKYYSTVTPGLNFKVPFFQKVYVLDVRTQSVDSAVVAGTNDLQKVNTAVNVNFIVDPNKVADVFSRTGFANVESLISKRIIETTTAVVAEYRAEDLLKQREIVKGRIVEDLRKKLTPYNILIEDVQITEFRFSEAYSKAIEEKQIAEQSALTAINNTKRVKEEAVQAIEKAKGQAEAIRIQTEAIQNSGGQSYVDLKAIEAWNGVLPTTMAGNSTPFIKLK